MLTYDDLVRELFPRLSGGIRWGLERTGRLLEAVGDPQRRFRSLHVGGTNGKGSAAATIEAVLLADGRATGLYTSPHLCTFRERIRIGGRPIAEAALIEAAERLWPAIRRESPSFFEATTALAFLSLARADVAWASVEVGLGGRLDATNVIRPEAAIITNIALDHAEHLGDTTTAVAAEKAGIIKAGVPVITGEREEAALRVLRDRASAVGAPFHTLEPDAPMAVEVGMDGTRFRLRTLAWGELDLHTPLIGEHQATNVALAVRALELLAEPDRPSREAVRAGVAATRWPGRLQIERVDGRTWVFDAAHNPAGAESLAATLRRLPLPRPVVLLFGVLADKHWRSMLPVLAGAVDAAVLTVPASAPAERRWDPASAAAELALPRPLVEPDFDAALAEAAREAGPAGTVIAAGSVHTAGDALERLGLAPWGVDPALPAPDVRV